MGTQRAIAVSARALIVFSLLLGYSTPRTLAQSAFWSTGATSGGSWGIPSNWQGGTIPAGDVGVAAFALNFNAGATVTLDGDRVIGLIISTSANPWNIDAGIGGTLKVNTFNVSGGTLTVSTPLQGADFNKEGSGTLTLSNPNSNFSNDITIKAGTLSLVGLANYSSTSNKIHLASGTILDATQLTGGLRYGGSPDTRTAVNNGDTLDGTGTVKGGLKVKSGGTVYPGENGVGTLTIDGKTLFETGSNLKVKLGTANPGASNTSNRLDILGELTLQTGTKIPVDGSNQSFTAGQTYRYRIATSDTDSFFLGLPIILPTNFNSPASSGDFSLSHTGGNLFLDFTPVPEPVSVMAIGFGVATVISVLSRRKY